MKLSKQQEKELLKAYNSYWESYLKGDVKTMAGLLAKEYTQVGSAESEVFSNRKDAVQFLHDTIHEVAGKLEMRNRIIKPEQQDRFILVHENCDLYALTGKKWVFYSRFRASSLMQEKKGGWKFIHQHSSFPDTKAEEGQNIAIDKIAKENLQLKEAVKRRTIELEETNRELEIETALEKVRAIAMGMKEPADMLQVCKTISLQLNSLGIKETRNVQTAIFYEDKGTYMNYEYYAKHNKTIITETSYTNNEMHQEFASQMLKGKGEFFSRHIKGKKKVADWLAYQRTTNVFIDTFLETAKSLSYYWFSLGPVALGISTYVPLNEEETGLFKRFLKVFELSYRRYLDIEKAEAQAREARIETALERVRAVAMAMKQSEELTSVCGIMYKELTSLGFTNIRNAQIAINLKAYQSWLIFEYSDYGEINMKKVNVSDGNVSPLLQEISTEIAKSKDALFQKHITGKEFEEWRTWRMEVDGLVDPRVTTAHSMCFYLYAVESGVLGISTFNEISEDQLEIVKRFKNVFELSYTRFDDLQKAEEQAREAKIEAALEKVRSRSLAMHNSLELNDVVTILFEKLKELQIPVTAAGIGIYSNSSKDMSCYVCGENREGLVIKTYRLPYFNNKICEDFYHSYEEQVEFFVGHYSKKEKNDFYELVLQQTELKFLPEDVKSLIMESASYTISMFPVKHAVFNVNDFEGKVLSEGQINILKRFAKVFEQAYTRFLDLQKAEVQAREAEIELALERVRARTMAMQKSEELPEAANLLFQQMQALGMPAWSAGYCIWDDDKQGITLWMSSEGVMQPSFHMPLTVDPSLIHWKEAYERHESFHMEAVGGEELIRHYKYMRTLPGIGEVLDSIINAGHPLPTFQIFHCAYFSQGFLLFITYESVPEAHEIFKRFGKVFDQTYTRFLDLQKAEAQAREAQIEAALERTRTQSMIMQHSSELDDTLRVFHEQVLLLGIKSAFSFLWLPDEENDRHIFWAAWAENNSTTFRSKAINYPLDRNEPATKQCLIDWKGNEPVVSYHVPPAGVAGYFAAWQELIDGVEQLKPEYFSDGLYYVEAFMKYGCFGVIVKNTLAEDEKKILDRFATEFERTYRRFLDLQKAEAQAREAQIEAALEKVRSRSLGMHKSEEILDVVKTVFARLSELNIELNTAFIIIFKEGSRDTEWWLINKDQGEYSSITVEYANLALLKEMFEVRAQGKEVFSATYYTEEKNELFRYLFTKTDFKYAPPERQKFIFESDAVSISMGITDKVAIQITRHNKKSFSDADNDIIRRFAKVFDQSYTRFLDLQKAEAQAREGQIQLALERVRARTMAMQKSDELADVAGLLFKQVKDLGIKSWTTGFNVWSEDNNFYTDYITSPQGGFVTPYTIDARSLPVGVRLSNAKKNGQEFYVNYEEGEALAETYRTLLKFGEKQFTEFLESGFDFPTSQYEYFVFGARVSLMFITYDAVPEAEDIFKRFGKVFEQTYTRFLDLQNAEAQAREAQIELSLERVRAKTMAMHNSQDVGDTVAVMFDEVMKLGIETIRCGIGIMHEPGEMEIWTAKPDENGKVDLIIGRMDMMIHPLLQGAFEAWRNKQEFYTYELTGGDLIDYFSAINNHPGYPVKYDIASLPSKIFHSEFHFPEGTLFVFSLEKLSAEASKIFKRFAGVFGQTYRRYLDLKKAEAQMREAQIEAALERVRSRTMAMHKGNELADTAMLLFDQLISLGIKPRSCGFLIMDENSRTMDDWSANRDGQGKSIIVTGKIAFDQHPILAGVVATWQKGEPYYLGSIHGEELQKYYEMVTAKQTSSADIKENVLAVSTSEYTSSFFFQYGMMYVLTPVQLTEHEINVMLRFASVFRLTYTRFLDLQRAETQAREATIEAALEKVRGKAMAMHTSNDLSATASMVFTELRKLGITPIRSGVGILNKESRKAQLYSATSSSSGDSLSLVGWIMLTNHPVAAKIYDSWLMGEDYYPELIGEQLKSYYENLLSGLSLPSIPDWKDGQKQYGTFLSFSVGCLYAWSENPYSSDEIKILKRFGSIIDLTFRRYIELQKSEASAKEAVKQASLDRVRAEIASMRTITDLDRITPLIWNELNILGVPFTRCGVFIMDESQEIIHTFLSTPEGKAIAAFHISYATPGNIVQVLQHWQQKSIYIDHWDEATFNDFADTLVKQGAIASSGQYLETIPHGGFNLHFLPFLQGMLYVGNTTKLGEDEIKLVQSVAEAFSTAYARYEDFNKLEAAKQTVEKTLVDLRQTQTQLVQAEKMASLGQLTAGIAHEIQNPLNFVNNFSEVSEELIKEMLEEVNKGNIDEVKAIAGDLVQNLEKIYHHGKRADSIVKGMLEHSRTSTGNMEPTDINALADEYLRLSYHGIRAKDKSFNTAIHTDFDTTINKINIIGQDIGRVLLNLYNNSFYAVNEKKKQLTTGYDPAVSVTTKKTGDTILISVKDNGNGIPQNIIDKIFQPFFTTKPTGSGTGLGLSLAYDIVKAHGGELKVESTEGSGTAFIISLIANS